VGGYLEPSRQLTGNASHNVIGMFRLYATGQWTFARAVFYTRSFGRWCHYFAPEGCKVLWSACLFVCLSARMSQKPHPNFTKFSYVLPVAVAPSFSDSGV